MNNFWRGWSILGNGLASIFEHMGSIMTFGAYPRSRNYQFSQYNSAEEALTADWQAVSRDWNTVLGDLDVALAKSKTKDEAEKALADAEAAFKEAEDRYKNSLKGNSNGQN